ncbi:hypothetical protein L5515_012961 [Caenorhabditis briggsae]|uniref:Uncharacterized protein n=1 Tax=Caenorhabditis briggsae TaxID=6238 RepID=A0AAE9J4V2_CAEBR|nr:hypothetical protein L5515_012961 [Caenorhabditis briggsae]
MFLWLISATAFALTLLCGKKNKKIAKARQKVVQSGFGITTTGGGGGATVMETCAGGNGPSKMEKPAEALIKNEKENKQGDVKVEETREKSKNKSEKNDKKGSKKSQKESVQTKGSKQDKSKNAEIAEENKKVEDEKKGKKEELKPMDFKYDAKQMAIARGAKADKKDYQTFNDCISDWDDEPADKNNKKAQHR